MIMVLAHHYILEEKVVRSIIGKMAVDIFTDNIEKLFHLSPANQFQTITYDIADK